MPARSRSSCNTRRTKAHERKLVLLQQLKDARRKQKQAKRGVVDASEQHTTGAAASGANSPPRYRRDRKPRIMRGEDEDVADLASAAQRNDIPGFWTIPRAIAWLLYGNPMAPLPDRGNDARLLDRAEGVLAAEFRAGRVTPFGRPQATVSEDPAGTERRRIMPEELLGTIVFNPGGHLPQRSWVCVHDRGARRSHRNWSDVIVPEEQLRRLHPNPLVRSEDGAQNTAAGVPIAQEPNVSGGSSDTPRLATASEIEVEMAAEYARAESARARPPNVNEIIPRVRAMLHMRGLHALAKAIRSVANKPQIKEMRLPRGVRWDRSSRRFSPFPPTKLRKS